MVLFASTMTGMDMLLPILFFVFRGNRRRNDTYDTQRVRFAVQATDQRVGN